MPEDEKIDVVDENGNFIEVVYKGEAHQKGLLHKTVIGAVVNSKGEWLLVKPVLGRQDAGQYVFPVGGHVTSGEKEVDAIRRETAEEIGITGDFTCELVDRRIFNREIIGRKENHLFLIYKISSDASPVLGDEDESLEYFTEDEIRKNAKENPKFFGDAFYFVAQSFFPGLR